MLYRLLPLRVKHAYKPHVRDPSDRRAEQGSLEGAVAVRLLSEQPRRRTRYDLLDERISHE